MAKHPGLSTLALAGLLAVAGPGRADDFLCYRDWIGFYAEEEAVLCAVDADSPGETFRLWLLADLVPRQVPLAELTVEIGGFPVEGMIAEIQWLTPHEGGEELNGVHTWHFDPPQQPGPLLELAVVDLQLTQPLPDDVRVEVLGGSTRDAYGQVYETLPTFLTINCTGALPFGCGCNGYADGAPGLDWLRFSAVEPAPGSVVSSEFELGFNVASFHCWDAWGSYGASSLAYEGEVRVDGLLVQTFSGLGHGEHSVPLSATGLPPGSAMTVTLLATNLEGQQTIEFSYTVDDLVPAAPESWSRVKSRY